MITNDEIYYGNSLKCQAETIDKLKEENKKINQLKEMYHEKMLNFRMAYLKQQNRINKSIKYIENHQLVFRDHTTEEIDEWFNQFYIDILDILKGVER